MSSGTLNLPVQERTVKKLKALAMLTGKTVAEIEADLGELLERMLSNEIHQRTNELDGISETSYTFAARAAESIPAGAPVVKVATPEPTPRKEEEDEFFSEQASEFGHELSGDEDAGESKSLAEQVEEETDDEDIQFTTRAAPVVGSNAEAFLDAAMGDPDEGPPTKGPGNTTRGYGQWGESPRGISKAFNPQRRQARISEFTGDDEAYP
jgi:hypothetical protein